MRPASCRTQLVAERVTDVDDSVIEAGRMKQPRLGGSIVRQGLVIVEMVTGQVREHRRMEAHAVHPALIQRMRGHFHAEVPVTCVTPLGYVGDGRRRSLASYGP